MGMKSIRPVDKDLFRAIAKTVLPPTIRHWIRIQQFTRQDRELRKPHRRLFRDHLRPTDVFLVGHPKSGYVWLAYMLAVVMERNFEKNVTLANVSDFIPTIHAEDSKVAYYAQFPAPRIFRNENPVFPELYPRTIYLVRDPRAVLISYYHHFVHDRVKDDWSLQAFVDEMLTYGCIKHFEPYLIRWDRHVLNWLKRAKYQPVKIVRYEEMIDNRRKVLQEVIEFAGIKCTDKEIAQAVERGSFENMRKNEDIYGAESYFGSKGERGYFVRRGEVDGWKEEMAQDLAKRIESEFSEDMKKVGYLR